MAYGILNDEHLIAIGDAIRAKNNTTNTYKASEMAAAITNLPGEETLDQVLEGTIIGDYYNDRITTLKHYAFFGTKVTSVDLPNVTSVGVDALSNNGWLESVNLPKVTSLRDEAFKYCGLTTANLPKVTEIGKSAFQYCMNLAKIEFTDLESIGEYAFNNCSSLTTLILRDSVGYSNRVCELNGDYVFTNTPIAKGTGYIYVPKRVLSRYQDGINWEDYKDQIRAIEDYPEICG